MSEKSEVSECGIRERGARLKLAVEKVGAPRRASCCDVKSINQLIDVTAKWKVKECQLQLYHEVVIGCWEYLMDIGHVISCSVLERKSHSALDKLKGSLCVVSES